MAGVFLRPNAPGNVEFRNIDQLACHLVEANVDFNIDLEAVDAGFKAACQQVVPDSPLEKEPCAPPHTARA